MNSMWTKRQGKLLVLLTLIISLIALVGCSDDDNGSKKFNVAGTVVSNDGQALAGITVAVEGGNTKTTTDENGNWGFTKVKKGKVIKPVNTDTYTFAGSYEVTADKSNVEFKATEDYDTGDDDSNDGNDDDNDDGQDDEATVEVIDAKTIRVTFSDDTVTEITMEEELKPGENEVTFEYDGKSYTKTVTYNAPGVESIKLVSYRHLKVTYNTIVDHKTAGELDNYYFNINEGNAAYSAIDLSSSNRLSELIAPTNIDIQVTEQDAKTVVDIYLAEDARFTNELDQETTTDAERTLEVEYAGLNENKKLTQGEEIEVAVRNVATKNGKLSIDTTVHEITIEDEDDPRCQSLVLSGDYETSNLGQQIEFGGEIERVIPSADHEGNNVELKFDEPVFDGHDLKHGTDEAKNVRVYVNNIEVASTTQIDSNGDDLASTLDNVMHFNMAAGDSYQQAATAVVKIKSLLEAYETEADLDEDSVYEVGKNYNVTITGVRDLAGNNMERAEIKFKVNLVDDDPEDDPGDEEPAVHYDTLPPQVEEVKQVADNIFRIKFVTAEDEDYEGDEAPGQPLANVTARFILEGGNYDEGTIERNVPLSNEQGYSYVQVPAIDEEEYGADDVLSYGENNSISRKVTIANPWRIGEADIDDDDSLEANVFLHEGESETIANFVLKKDKFAPIFDEYGSDKSYYPGRDIVDTVAEENSPGDKGDRTIVFEVKDVVPDTIAANAHYKNPVVPVRYEYDASQERVKTNNPVPLNDQSGIFLPIKVSYTKNGIVHEAVITNKDLVDNKSKNPDTEVQFVTYQDSEGINRYQLKLDLTGYDSLLDNNGRLVDDVTYQVEVPEGFFADAPTDVVFDSDNETGAYGDYVGQADVDDAPSYLDFANGNYQETFNQDVGFTDPIFVENDLVSLSEEDVRSKQYSVDSDTYNDIYDVQFVADERPELNYGFTSEAFAFEFTTPDDYIDGNDDSTDGHDPDDDDTDNPEDEVPQTTKILVEYNDEKNQIMVKFTGGIDPATLKDPSNYTISGQSLADLGITSADMKYIVEAIGDESQESEDSDGQFSIAAFEVPEGAIENDGVNVNFTVAGVSNNYGGTMTPLRTQLVLQDTTQPVPECKLIGDQEIRLDFKEEVNYRDEATKYTAADNFIVIYDNQQLRVAEAEIIDAPANRLTLNLDSALYQDVDEIDTSKLIVKVRKNENDSMLIVDDANLKNPLREGEYAVTYSESE